MSLDLNDYFKLGLETTNNPLQNSLVNTIRTPTDTHSTALNRVTFKCPKVGMLTADSVLSLQFQQTGSNATVNLVNGALGAISRFRILLGGGQVLTDLEFPSLLTTNDLYSTHTQTQLQDYQQFMIGNQFVTDTQVYTGLESVAENLRVRNEPGAANSVIIGNNIRDAANSHIFGIPLRLLGAQFLDAASLPVFLLGNREMIFEINFHDDCREYAVGGGGAALGASDITVNLARCELVTTHIMLPDEIELKELANLQSKPVQYPLIDNYVIKAVSNNAALNVANNTLYRLNLQHKELHKLLTVFKDQAPPATSTILANQKALALGDYQLQIKMNGQNIFERPVLSSAIFYQLLTYYNNGLSLKAPYNVVNVNNHSINNTNQNNEALYADARGSMGQIGVDFSNGNLGIFGAGTQQRTALEFDITITPRAGANPTQTGQKDLLFYASVSKLLTIGAQKIDISF